MAGSKGGDDSTKDALEHLNSYLDDQSYDLELWSEGSNCQLEGEVSGGIDGRVTVNYCGENGFTVNALEGGEDVVDYKKELETVVNSFLNKVKYIEETVRPVE